MEMYNKYYTTEAMNSSAREYRYLNLTFYWFYLPRAVACPTTVMAGPALMTPSRI